jgi:iron complex outermembrane receptor protein
VIGFHLVQLKERCNWCSWSNWAEDFDNVASPSPAQLLRGKVAGTSYTIKWEPGSGVSIRVRGNTSIRSGNGPLIVVDGVPLENVSGGGIIY